MFGILAATSAALFVLLYLLRRRQESFCISIHGMRLQVKRGAPPQALLSHCRRVADDARTLKGTVRGIRRGNGVVLMCSRSIPASYRQDIRLFWQKQPHSSEPKGQL
ncbi:MULTISPECIES: DUF3634 family protein [Oceanimonas]|uniref:DUF3634 domain-containing protein n=1 Tax=Oceanimonas doudoroffii TaxID=84158 RepID=A0A233RDF9_9GAMM|nr:MULTISPECIES: DUF3634 family protein [Oceanimonas]NHH99352.1 hypothetical protein [Oceanimonas sp. MB9]OXY81402.1 hypothetical protein B6S08_13025 [Oceanimonas doudoroffii]